MEAVQNLVNFENPEDLVADKITENVKITVQTILKVEEKHLRCEFSFTDPTSGYCNPFIMDPKSHSVNILIMKVIHGLLILEN